MSRKRTVAALLVLAVAVAGCAAGSKGDFNAPWRPVELTGDGGSALPPVYLPPAGEPAAGAQPEPADQASQGAVADAPALSENPPVAVAAPEPQPKPPAKTEQATPVQPKPPAAAPVTPAPKPAPAPAPQNPAPTTPAPAKPVPVPVTPPLEQPTPKPQPDPEQPDPEQPAPKPQDPGADPEPGQPAPEPPLPPPAVEPGPVPTPAGLSADEALMVKLVNEERAKAGLPTLQVEMQLVSTARVKSQDMVTHNYFAHDSARLGSPFDQMKAAGIRYMTAGENIAGNPSVEGAHRSLMNSPGHRANILSKSFKKIGIGIIHGGPYGIMFTQQFIG